MVKQFGEINNKGEVMRKENKIWKSPKKSEKSRSYVGSYSWYKGERQLEFVAILRNGKKHRVVFESHEAAKTQGWKAVLQK